VTLSHWTVLVSVLVRIYCKIQGRPSGIGGPYFCSGPRLCTADAVVVWLCIVCFVQWRWTCEKFSVLDLCCNLIGNNCSSLSINLSSVIFSSWAGVIQLSRGHWCTPVIHAPESASLVVERIYARLPVQVFCTSFLVPYSGVCVTIVTLVVLMSQPSVYLINIWLIALASYVVMFSLDFIVMSGQCVICEVSVHGLGYNWTTFYRSKQLC